MFVRYKNKTYEVEERTPSFLEKRDNFLPIIRKEYKKRKLLILALNNKKIKDITEIEGLAELTDLKWLSLQLNKIEEIKGLETLINLEVLLLHRNQITEIKGLESLTNLRYLSLEHNQIREIKELDTLTNLQGLTLSKNQITEIKGLRNLKFLKRFTIRKNPISDWADRCLGGISNRYYAVYYPNAFTEYSRTGRIPTWLSQAQRRGLTLAQAAKIGSSMAGLGADLTNIRQDGFQLSDIDESLDKGLKTTGEIIDILDEEPPEVSYASPPPPQYGRNITPKENIVAKVEQLKELLDKGLITEDDFEAKKKDLLNKL